MTWFAGRSQSERRLITITALIGALWLCSVPISWAAEHINEVETQTIVRRRHYDELRRQVRRYHELDQRLAKLKESFAASEMTFEQVASELDRIVQKSIGSNNYDLTKSGDPAPLGLDFEKQDFTLNIRSLTLEQLVNLLYEIEQGKSPLFMGKVDILQGTSEGTFRATLEIASISRSKNQG